MDDTDRNRRWAFIAVALIIAAGLGYALARFTNHPPQIETTKTSAAKTSDVLEIPESSLTTMGISLEAVTPGNLGAEIQASAKVSAAANGQAIVTSRAAGTVVRLNKRLGDPVKAGEVLALVESREAAAMAADRTVAVSKVELARSNLKREQSLYEQKVTPRQDFEAAQAQLAAAEAEFARANASAAGAGVSGDGRSLALVSPIAGRITAANIALGAYVEPAMELFRVADPRFVLIEASVSASDASKIRNGDAAKIITASGSNLNAIVLSVTPTVSEQTRAATVTLSLVAGQTPPAPGEFVRARIMTQSDSKDAFVVPEDAVQSVNGHDVVFVRTVKGFKVAPVTISARSGGRAAIVSGLQAGEKIATQNAFLLKAELGKGAEEEE